MQTISHPATLAEPIFTTTGKQASASLFDLFARFTDGESLELPRMAPHQRVPVATALSILMTVLRRYAKSPLQTPAEWEAEWMTQIGADALRLKVPDTEVGFLQPPLEAAGFRSPMTLSDIDLTFAKLAHAVKPIDAGSAEEAVLALMGGTWRSSALKWIGGSRYGLAAVLASDDGSLAGEVRHLVAAYEAGPSGLSRRHANATRASDHLLWLRPVTQSVLNPDCIPWPYHEARPCHLVKQGEGVFNGIGQHSAPRRLAGDSHAGDPHVPLIKGAPYRLSDKRPWSLNTLHEMLFGSERTTRPAALGVSGYRCVRVCAVTTRQATTLGYREAFFPVAQTAAFSLFSRPDRAAELSRRALDTTSLVSKKLAYAAGKLVDGSDKSAAVESFRAAVKTQFLNEVSHPLTQVVLQLLERAEDPAGEQASLNACAVATARFIWARCISGSHRPLAIAETSSYLNYHFKQLTGESSMTETPEMAQQCHAILRDFASHLTPEQRAKLRSMVPARPAMAYYTGLAAIPVSLRDAPVWSVLLPVLGRLRPNGQHPGRALADTGYPELRMQRLLAASGEILDDQVSTACRWLISREVTAVDLGLLAALGVADWQDDVETLKALRTHLALGYVTQARQRSAA